MSYIVPDMMINPSEMVGETNTSTNTMDTQPFSGVGLAISPREQLEREDRIKYLKKMSEVKKRVLACDWSPDKINTAFGFKYVSDGKIMRNIMPILVACGVDFIVNYDNPVELKPLDKMQHWIVDTHAYFVDVDTGYIGDRLYAPGEGSDSSSGSLYKAKTFGRKTILVSYFGITDNIELDGPLMDRIGSGFKPKSEEETAEIKAKISDVAIKPNPPAPKAKESKPKAPKKAEDAPETPVEGTDAPKDVPKPPKASKASKKAPESDAEDDLCLDDYMPAFAISDVQLKAAQKSIAKWHNALKDGKITQDKMDQVLNSFKMVSSMSSLISFMREHATVPE